MLKEKLAAQFDFLKAKAPPLVGCDISSSSVKLVEIAEAGRNVYRVERYAIEPLPKDHPLWTMPNVLITPHSMSTASDENTRLVDLFCDNLRRYVDGQPLRNEIDKVRGY